MKRTFCILALAACGSSPPPARSTGPRGLRATEHLELARQHDQLARIHPLVPDTAAAPDSAGTPWLRRWDSASEHEQVAATHRARAAELQAEYEQACGSRSLADVSTSPLAAAIGGWPTATGVIFYLKASYGPPDKLLSDIRCHRAWMMLAPTGMDDCPLDLPSIVVDARGDLDGITVSVVERDPALVDELHRRAAHELETSVPRGPVR